jgi:hypothetical protein
MLRRACLLLLAGTFATGCGRSSLLPPSCVLQVPPTFDVGAVPYRGHITTNVLLVNAGSDQCTVSGLALAPGGDSGFTFDGPNSATIDVDNSLAVPILFRALDDAPPPVRTATLQLASNDPSAPQASVLLTAEIGDHCILSVAPTALDFGTVAVGASNTLSVTLTSSGSAACNVTAGIVGDPSFTLPAPSLSVAPGGTAQLAVAFAPHDDGPPPMRQGTLEIDSDDPDHPRTTVALTGAVAPHCTLTVMPASVDFGQVTIGTTATRSVMLGNTGDAACTVDNFAIAAGSDPAFALASAPGPITLAPGANATVAVRFSPMDDMPPLTRTGTLDFTSNDPLQANVQVPLTAQIYSDCVLTITPNPVDFGHVALGTTATRSATLTNKGTTRCTIGDIAIDAKSDPEFLLASGQPTQLVIQPGASATIPIEFAANDVHPPHAKQGWLDFTSDDMSQPTVMVPLDAYIDIGCDLTITPTALHFGLVILNTMTSAPVVLGNDGSAPCSVSGVALTPTTDPDFSLTAGQAKSFVVAPGAQVSITIDFTAADSAPPHLKTGMLVFATGNTRMPNAMVPLDAYVSTKCIEASQWIYTVDQNAVLARFDPKTLTFTNLTTLNCPSSSYPNSLAVDQDAIAWIGYFDGTLYRVDVQNPTCTATTFQVGQDGIINFGMGFVFFPSTGQDVLYIAGGPNTTTSPTTLATVSFPGLTVSPVGQFAGGQAELTGTGDGTLWGFVPEGLTSSGYSTLYQIDPTNASILQSFTYPTMHGMSNWAMKFWGGQFWIFLNTALYKVDRNNPASYTTAIANTGRMIVGAGVSTCAPLH